ncbi:MAG: GNAT family protein, partial [Ginsengibacter sp.]
IGKGIIANKSICWAITLKHNPIVIGTICYWNISVENDIAEIGYELKPKFQGKGIMQAAISKAIAFGFNEIKLKVITALPKEGNNKSIQLLLKNNFQFDADLRICSKEAAGGLLVYYLTQNSDEIKGI